MAFKNGRAQMTPAQAGPAQEVPARALPAQALPAQRDPRRRPIGQGTPGPLGDSVSNHTAANGALVVVRRTRRRKTGIAAFWEDGRAVIAAPARLSIEDEQYWVPHMVSRLEADRRALAGGRRRAPHSDDALMRRCKFLSETYLGGRAVPASVRWVTNQNGRWGSCTHAHGTIRISHQVQGMPEWVVDYVLLHELAHLIHPNHSAAFWAELSRFEPLERSKAFLEGAAFASARNITGMGADVDGEGDGADADDPDSAGFGGAGFEGGEFEGGGSAGSGNAGEPWSAELF